jgi:serine/threonine protein kinase
MSMKGDDSEKSQGLPTILGYELLHEIGRGGMGIVYRARDAGFDRDVAIKLLGEEISADSFAVARFRNEARITGQLQHPGIPAAHHLGTLADGKPFLAMKLIKGSTLQSMLSQRAAVAEDRGRFIAIFEQVCHAVGYAHAHQVIHRDLKPSNIMVGKFGEVQIMDWGLAKVLGAAPKSGPWSSVEEEGALSTLGLYSSAIDTPQASDSATRTGSVLGTPAYMSPEQAGGEIRRLDARSDVFSLGAILCQILTGKPPYVGGEHDIRIKAVRGDLRDALERLKACDAERDFIRLAEKCLSFEQQDRPATAQAVADEVSRIRIEAEARARDAELQRNAALVREMEAKKRRRQLLIAGIWIVGVLLLGMLGTTTGLVLTRRATLETEKERSRAVTREQEAIDAVKRFGDAVANNPELKNHEQLKPLRKELLKEPLAFFKSLRERLLVDRSARPDSLDRLASAALDLGRLTDEIGDKQDALRAFEEAGSIYEQLTRENPSSVEFQSDLAECYTRIGVVQFRNGNLEEAQGAFEKSKSIREHLSRQSPSTAKQHSDLAGSIYHLAILWQETGKIAESKAAHEQVKSIWTRLIQENPKSVDFKSSLAACTNNLGNLHRETGEFEAALAAYKEAKDLREQLVKENPADVEFKIALARSYNNLGSILGRMGHPAEALSMHQRSREILDGLVQESPTDIDFQSSLAMNSQNLAILYSQTGKPNEALEAYQKGKVILERLVQDNPVVNEFQSRLARNLFNLGALYAQLGKSEEALESYLAAQRTLERLVAESPTVAEHRQDLGVCLNNLGALLSSTDQLSEALAAYEEAKSIRSQLVNEYPNVAEYQSHLATTLYNLGLLLNDAGKLDEALKAYDQARVLGERLVREHPRITDYQIDLAELLNSIAASQIAGGKFSDAKELALKATAHAKIACNGNPQSIHYQTIRQNSFVTLRDAARALNDRDLEAEAEKGLEGLAKPSP